MESNKHIHFSNINRNNAEKIMGRNGQKIQDITKILNNAGHSLETIQSMFTRESVYVASHLQRTPTAMCAEIFDRVIMDGLK